MDLVDPLRVREHRRAAAERVAAAVKGDRGVLLEVPVPVGLAVAAGLQEHVGVGDGEPHRPRVTLRRVTADRRELDRRAVFRAGERRRDLRERRLLGHRQSSGRHQEGRRQLPPHAARPFMNTAVARATRLRGTNRSVVVARLFMKPFTSTVSRPSAPTAWSATSSALIQKNPGTALASMRAFSWNSVRVNPGHTQSTWTPVPRSSAAIASLKLSTNAFVAPYVALYAIGPNAAIDAMFITEPHRRATMPGRQRPVNSTRASTFNRTSSSSCSTGSWSKRPPVPKPALFTSHSTVRPRRST